MTSVLAVLFGQPLFGGLRIESLSERLSVGSRYINTCALPSQFYEFPPNATMRGVKGVAQPYVKKGTTHQQVGGSILVLVGDDGDDWMPAGIKRTFPRRPAYLLTAIRPLV